MKTIIAFLCAATFGIVAGVACGAAFAITEVTDEAMAPALIENEHVLLDLFVADKKDSQRGDVVAIANPLYLETGEDSLMLKRIVALPGETVEIAEGLVWIDEVPMTEDAFAFLHIGNETMERKTVPEDCYFVLGDNLAHSTDSRHVTVGMIREEDILGKVILEW